MIRSSRVQTSDPKLPSSGGLRSRPKQDEGPWNRPRARRPRRANPLGAARFVAVVSSLTWSLSCGADLETTRAEATLHQLAECPLPAEVSDFDLEAFGDFGAGPDVAEALSAADAGRQLTFPDTTRQIRAGSVGGVERFIGVSTGPGGRDLPVLLWPEARACDLSSSSTYPASGGGQAVGLHPDRGMVLVAGGDAGPSSAVVGALTFDVRRGDSTLVNAAARDVLLEPRAFATATACGDGSFLVAGGEDPLLSSAAPAERDVSTTAEVFSIDQMRFSGDRIELRVPRTRHAAVVLPSGETLLVGGRDEDGGATTVLEAVSPETRVSSLGGLASLSRGRIAPIVVGLEDGRFLVVGGESSDGEPVGPIEWLSPDGSEHMATSNAIPARYDTTATSLPGGSALIVTGCAPQSDGEVCAPCERGCPPDDGFAAYWIDPEGEARRVPLDVDAPRPRLVAASDGAPWLVTGSPDAPVLRFNPWRARFDSASLRGVDAASATAPLLALDPGAFVWISEGPGGAHLQGLRSDTRRRFSRDVGLVVQTAITDAGWPLHLAPDRAPDAPGAPRYDGRLVLDEGPVWLTDVDFADVSLSIETTGTPPIVHLGKESYGDAAHPWPDGSGASYAVVRRGESITLWRPVADGNAAAAPANELPSDARTYEVGSERVRVALSSSGGDTVVSTFTVERLDSSAFSENPGSE